MVDNKIVTFGVIALLIVGSMFAINFLALGSEDQLTGASIFNMFKVSRTNVEKVSVEKQTFGKKTTEVGTCKTDVECGNGYYCNLENNNGRCTKLLGPGGNCFIRYGTGAVMVNNYIRCGPTLVCSTSNMRCISDRSTCIENSDCDENEYCRVNQDFWFASCSPKIRKDQICYDPITTPEYGPAECLSNNDPVVFSENGDLVSFDYRCMRNSDWARMNNQPLPPYESVSRCKGPYPPLRR